MVHVIKINHYLLCQKIENCLTHIPNYTSRNHASGTSVAGDYISRLSAEHTGKRNLSCNRKVYLRLRFAGSICLKRKPSLLFTLTYQVSVVIGKFMT